MDFSGVKNLQVDEGVFARPVALLDPAGVNHRQRRVGAVTAVNEVRLGRDQRARYISRKKQLMGERVGVACLGLGDEEAAVLVLEYVAAVGTVAPWADLLVGIDGRVVRGNKGGAQYCLMETVQHRRVMVHRTDDAPEQSGLDH